MISDKHKCTDGSNSLTWRTVNSPHLKNPKNAIIQAVSSMQSTKELNTPFFLAEHKYSAELKM